MQSGTTKSDRNFVGRRQELEMLSKIGNAGEASIVIVYGRRRVGKTLLIEHVYRDRNLMKFEGIEGLSKKEQMQSVLRQFSTYVKDPLIAKLNLDNWTEIFQLIAKYAMNGAWTVFLDEIQWLASYEGKMFAELKYVWDNFFKKNDSLILILCGSSPSFIISEILHSKALYNRSQYELPLNEFDLNETKLFLGKARSPREIMDAYLTIGGIPEYLKYVNKESSIFLGLCKNSFINGGFFLNEYARIFTSSLGTDKNYSKIIEFLSRRKFATRDEIAKHLRIKSGGTLSDLLANLELCGFIAKYSPFNLGEQSVLARYNISDQYLQFYFKFIAPLRDEIQNGKFDENPAMPLNMDIYNKWLGFGFERFCRKYHHIFAKLLGFEAVSYRAGAFFDRRSKMEQNSFQIDLLFERADRVYTVCEIKYLQTPADTQVMRELERKLANFPNHKKYTVHKVLIAAEGAGRQLQGRHYFDRVLTLNDIIIA